MKNQNKPHELKAQNLSFNSKNSDFDENQTVFYCLKAVSEILIKKAESDTDIAQSLVFYNELVSNLSENKDFKKVSELIAKQDSQLVANQISIEVIRLRLKAYSNKLKSQKGLKCVMTLIQKPSVPLTYLALYQLCEDNIALPENIDNESLETLAVTLSFNSAIEKCDKEAIANIQKSIIKEVEIIAELDSMTDNPIYLEQYKQHKKNLEQMKKYLKDVMFKNNPKYFTEELDKVRESIKRNINRFLEELEHIDKEISVIIKNQLDMTKNQIYYKFHV